MAFHDWQIEGGSGGTCPRIPVVAEVGGSCGVAALRLNASVALQGPYDSGTGLLSPDLNTGAYLPTLEPYTAMGWHSGSETTTSSVLATYPVVDWVLVELRDRNDAATIVETAVGLLLENGAIVDLDGVSPLPFDAGTNSYFVAIRHRNHLAVMTLNPVDLTASMVVDFRSTPLYGGANAAKDIGGVQVLWAGDATSDGAINASDRSASWNERNSSGYKTADVDMSGSVNASDRSMCWNNRNKTSLIP